MSKQKVPELVEFIHAGKEVRPDGTVKGVGPHIGCVLARRVKVRNTKGRFESAISIGWSKVNSTAGDEFDKEKAMEIARGRAITGSAPSLPRQLERAYNNMCDRASAYFKGVYWA